MSNPEKLDVIKAALNEPRNFEAAGRTASGLLLTECVDRRLVSAGGRIRTPGNSYVTATTMVMRGVADGMREGLVQASRFLRMGAHGKVCAYNQNLLPVVKLVADEDPKTMLLYAYLDESVNAGLSLDRAKPTDMTVVDRAQMAVEKLESQGHHPDELLGFVETLGGDVVMPGTPDVEHASAYVIDTDPGAQVLAEGVATSGDYYLDSHAKVLGQEALPDEFRPDMLALSAATAVLVARTHKLPILVADGVPGERIYATLR